MSQTVVPTPPAPSQAPPEAEKFVPDAVRQAAARADAAIAAAAAARAQGEPAASPPSPVPVGGQGQGEAPPVPAVGPGGTAQGAVPTPTPAPAPAPTTPDNAGGVSNAELEALRARLAQAEQNERTWRGRYEAELPRKDALAALETELEKARRELQEALNQRAANTLTAADSVPALTDAEREAFGTDMVDIIARQAHHTVLPLLDALRTTLTAEIARLRESMAPTQQIAAESAADRFYRAIEEALPGALALDNDPAFLAWLGEKDPLSGRTRQIMLDEKSSVRDVPACVEFFRAYLNQTGRPAPQSSGESPAPAKGPKSEAPTPVPPASRPAPTLSDFAAPGTARTTGTPALTGEQVMIWTRSEIADFYQKKGRGHYRTTPAEAERIEAEIFAAMKEGRIDEAR